MAPATRSTLARIQPGELFFAVKGERLDGHDFVDQALESGAVSAVIRKDQLARFSVKTCLLAVDDTLVALQTLATAVRRLWGKPVVGVTGSAGKTTTKEAIAHVLCSRFRVLKSEGNFNNHFGLPLASQTAARARGRGHRDGDVARWGDRGAGENRSARNRSRHVVAPVHLEYFESVAGIARAKYELIESLPQGERPSSMLTTNTSLSSAAISKVRSCSTASTRPPTFAPKTSSPAAQRASSFEVVANGARERILLPLVGSTTFRMCSLRLGGDSIAASAWRKPLRH